MNCERPFSSGIVFSINCPTLTELYSNHRCGHGAGKARSVQVAGEDRDRNRDRDCTGQRRGFGVGNALMPSSPLPPSFPSSEGPAKWRSTISVWREHVAKKSGEAGRSGAWRRR